MQKWRWLAAGMMVAGCARVPEPELVAGQCVMERQGTAERPDVAGWIALLLRGVDPVTRRVTTPALDCTGAQVRWEGPALACDDSALARTALPERPLVPEDVITSPARERETLVWIVTSRFASGEAVGPVALVDARGGVYRAVALGVLRAFPRKARLRLEQLGTQWVLVAEGELCAGADGSSCLQAARLMPLRQGRFESQPLQGADGACVSPAWFETARQETRRAEGRWERLELRASLVFGPAGLEIEESVAVTEVADRNAAQGSRLLRRAQATRTVHWDGGRLRASDGPLWSRVAGGSR